MTDNSLDYLSAWDLDGGDLTSWQQLFDNQTLEETGQKSHATGFNDGDRHKAPDESTPAAPLEAGFTHSFDETVLDPALFLDDSNIPWPTIEQHEPLLSTEQSSAAPVETAAQATDLAFDSIPTLHGHTYHQQQNFTDSINAWSCAPNQPIDAQQQWICGQATQGWTAPASIANMQDISSNMNESGKPLQNQDQDLPDPIADLNSFDQDMYDFTPDFDFYPSDHAQSGPSTMATSHNMPGQHNTPGQYAEPQPRIQPYPQSNQFPGVSLPHVAHDNNQLTHQNQSSLPHAPRAISDASFGPDAAYSPDMFSPTSDFSPAPSSQARRSRSRASNPPNVIVMKHSVTCVAPGCGKAFKNRTHILDLCNRCAKKHDRRTVEAQPIELDPSVPDIMSSRDLIFATQPGRGPPIPHDELTDILANEDRYIQRLLDAINEVVPGGEGGDLKKKGLSWEARQQITLNQALYMEGPRKGDDGLYRRPLITARLRALFREMCQFHTGIDASQDCFYPVGGANAGYNADTNLNFHERFEMVHELFRKNKRMVMDVIEGRGVKCIVSNPVGYNKRKVANNACNEDKKEIMGVGKERIEMEGSEPPRKRRRRQVADSTPEFEAPESSERQTRRSATIDQAGQSPEDPLDAHLREAFDASGFGVGSIEAE